MGNVHSKRLGAGWAVGYYYWTLRDWRMWRLGFQISVSGVNIHLGLLGLFLGWR